MNQADDSTDKTMHIKTQYEDEQLNKGHIRREMGTARRPNRDQVMQTMGDFIFPLKPSFKLKF